MNSKYRSVEDTVLTKNVLSELDLPEISNKLRVVSGTLNLNSLVTGNLNAPFLDSKGQAIALPRGAYIEKIILRYDGSVIGATPIGGIGTLTVGYSQLVNGVLGTLSAFDTSITGVANTVMNAGQVYNTDHIVAYDASYIVLTGTVSASGALSGVVRAIVYMSLP
jgi:hypothetical protein